MTKPVWLPDWKNASLYPAARGTPNTEWAWQFLRRNPKYQRLWKKEIKPRYKPSDLADSLDRAQRNERTIKISDRVQLYLEELGYNLTQFREQFGIRTLPPNPSEPTAKLVFDGQFVRFTQKPVNRRGTKPGWQYKPDLTLDDDDLLVWFDLSSPIEPQLERAGKILKDRALQTEKRRSRMDHFQDYLRILDGNAVGESVKTIANTIYRRDQENSEQRVRYGLDVALQLRDHDYWRIVARK